MTKTLSLSRAGIKLPKLPPYFKYDLVFWGFLAFSFLVPLYLAFTMEALAFQQRFHYIGIVTNTLLAVNAVVMITALFSSNLAIRNWTGVFFFSLNSFALPTAIVYRYILLTATTLPAGIKGDGEMLWLGIDLLCLLIVVRHYYATRDTAMIVSAKMPPNFYPVYLFLTLLHLVTLFFV